MRRVVRPADVLGPAEPDPRPTPPATDDVTEGAADVFAGRPRRWPLLAIGLLVVLFVGGSGRLLTSYDATGPRPSEDSPVQEAEAQGGAERALLDEARAALALFAAQMWAVDELSQWPRNGDAGEAATSAVAHLAHINGHLRDARTVAVTDPRAVRYVNAEGHEFLRRRVTLIVTRARALALLAELHDARFGDRGTLAPVQRRQLRDLLASDGLGEPVGAWGRALLRDQRGGAQAAARARRRAITSWQDAAHRLHGPPAARQLRAFVDRLPQDVIASLRVQSYLADALDRVSQPRRGPVSSGIRILPRGAVRR